MEATSPTTSWTVDLSDTIPGAGAATFPPTTTSQDCSDVTVTTGTGAGQWTVTGHGSRHVLIDLPGGGTGSGGASSDGSVSLWLLPTGRRPSDGLGADYANGAGSGGLVLPPGARGRYGLWVQTLDERTTWRVDLD